MIHISPNQMDAIAAILRVGMPICRYELAVNLTTEGDVLTSLQVIDRLADDGVIVITVMNGHPYVTSMASCILCEWCPTHSALAHSEHSQANSVMPVHHYIPVAP
jgi:hypothetical protein